jgi:hypothetical protein
VWRSEQYQSCDLRTNMSNFGYAGHGFSLKALLEDPNLQTAPSFNNGKRLISTYFDIKFLPPSIVFTVRMLCDLFTVRILYMYMGTSALRLIITFLSIGLRGSWQVMRKGRFAAVIFPLFL